MLYDPAPSWRFPFQDPAVSQPNVLHVETTTPCNMRCGMCVKQCAGSRVAERVLRLSGINGPLRALPLAMGMLKCLDLKLNK